MLLGDESRRCEEEDGGLGGGMVGNETPGDVPTLVISLLLFSGQVLERL